MGPYRVVDIADESGVSRAKIAVTLVGDFIIIKPHIMFGHRKG
ncbi:hypothetical protein ACFLWI_00865 [Chloroflexota bacterium]